MKLVINKLIQAAKSKLAARREAKEIARKQRILFSCGFEYFNYSNGCFAGNRAAIRKRNKVNIDRTANF